MQDSRGPKRESFTAFRSAAEEADTKREERAGDEEGRHLTSTAGRVMQVAGADLPYVVSLTHPGSEATEHSFATMREAEAFIKRNTPAPGNALSSVYDRPAPDSPTYQPDRPERVMTDDDILARLKVIDERLRRISTEDAASVLAGGLACAGIHEQERLRLITETERILDELDGTNVS
jgi:hypothetical protein